jgi:hypothetical protein
VRNHKNRDKVRKNPDVNTLLDDPLPYHNLSQTRPTNQPKGATMEEAAIG